MAMSSKNPGRFFHVASLVLVASFVNDLYLCPHSKVEESFQLQATHDLIYHGISPAMRVMFMREDNIISLPYDHLSFPGVVPRTFTGPLILASLCHVTRWICLPIFDLYTIDPMNVQFLARFFLLAFSAHGWVRFARAVDNQLSSSQLPHIGAWLLLVTACQFHIPFYASRMLPNTFALVVVLHSYTSWVQGNIPVAATLLVFGTAVFRCDLLLLLGCVGLLWLIRRQLTVWRALKIGITIGILSLICTVPMDSILWQRMVWPEGEVFYYNTILGKSSNWGTSAWHWYFTSAIPKGMLLTAILVPLSFLRLPEILVHYERTWWRHETTTTLLQPRIFDTAILPYLIPAIGFLILYSFLGHKEMRFIFPALPILNFAAAMGMARLHFHNTSSKEKRPTWIGRLAFVCGLLSILVTFAGSLVFSFVSRLNYPGGLALQELAVIAGDNAHRSAFSENRAIHVYVDVAAAMSGVSLFGQRSLQHQLSAFEVKFSKSGYEDEHSIRDFSKFQFMISEEAHPSGEHLQIATIPGNPRLDLRRLAIATSDSLYIQERMNNRSA